MGVMFSNINFKFPYFAGISECQYFTINYLAFKTYILELFNKSVTEVQEV
jgi:hypothetical protein